MKPEALEFLLRWGHYMAGVTWIGLLYYFNFVQGAYFKEAEGAAKSDATQKLVPRALWWFRWAAMLTFLTGLLIIIQKSILTDGAILTSTWALAILTGALLGTFMFLNVWFIIWPNQKVVIASAQAQAKGGKADGNTAACAAKALLASRTNTMFSIPMLFFMGAASHYPPTITAESLMPVTLAVLVIVGALELNAIKGKLGPIETVKGVITSGFVLTLVLFLTIEFLA